MITLGDVFVALRADGKPLREDLADAEKNTRSWATNLGGKVSGLLGGAVVAGVGAATAAVAGIGTAAFSAASDFDAATKRMQSQLDMTDQQAQRYGESIKNVFANNFGESIADVGESISEVERAFTRIGGTESFDELEGATEAALALRDAFGVEVVESTEAAVELIDKFGLTSQQAFDFLASGFQSGLNASDDFLESVTEYSTQFANGGADASQFFNILQTGLQAGNLGTDKAADAFKEFRLRIGDGSTLTATSLEMLGINAEAFTAKLANGTITTADAFDVVLQKLREVEDPTLRMQAAVGLIGTQFEDLGDSAALGLSIAKFELSDQAGAINALNKQYETLPTFFEGLKRRALVAIAPIGDAMLGIANAALPSIEAVFSRLETGIKNFIENSNFEWSPELKQIKLSDLFEFVQQNGVTSINIGEWFEFTGFGDAKQIKVGDLFEFTTDSGGTTINLADYVTIEMEPDGGPVLVDISKLVEITPFGFGDLFSFGGGADEGTGFDIGGLFTFDKSKVGTVELGDLFPFLGDNVEFKISDMLTIGTDYPVFQISDILPWLSESGEFDIGQAVTFDPSGLGKVELSDLFPFFERDVQIFNIADMLDLDLTGVGTIGLADIFPFLSEEGTFDLGSLFTSGEGEGGGPQWVNDLVAWEFPALGTEIDARLGQLLTFVWPDLPEGAKTTLTSLFSWAWPDVPTSISDLLGWDWPDVPGDISTLLTWIWPEFSASLTNIITTITSFRWPKLEKPAWIDQLLNFKIPTPDWVTRLLNWSPSLPSLPGWLGGGDDSTSSGGSIGPNNAYGSGEVNGSSVAASAAAAGVSVYVDLRGATIHDAVDVEQIAYRVGERLQYAT